ncbi:methyltransferase domain-containing protein [Amycolatopsis sp. NPDC059090]|uniref:methyltransferase domain-containing protein n=1 Tax=unclassified Amycolatopsis TaxID=2618356 RepID=UPI0036700487
MSTETLIRLLDAADALPGAADLRARTYDLLRLDPGEAVVDVGCGSGRAVAELADLGANAVGVDPDPGMLDAARQRWPRLDFQAGTAEALPLADGAVTGYRADKVFHDVRDVPAAFAEARRVLAPGGRIVLAGHDWDTFVIDSADPVLTRTIVHARADLVTNPSVARSYRTLLLDNGFTNVSVEMPTAVFTDAAMLPMATGLAEAARAAGTIERELVDGWIAEQTARARDGRFFAAVPLFIAAATRP